MPITALDLFAGTGWGVACKALNIEEYGVEIMPAAIATREANGMKTIYNDVWEGLEGRHDVPPHALLIASPPCQTFSMAGNGKGRQALDEVISLIDSRAYLDVRKLREFGEKHDMRTALVLTPLAHVARDVPTYVVFEQVPTVLPAWKRCAEEMREWGYSVWVGVLNAEQYGVPQTRKRAILIARADGKEAKMPTPTHSRYYSRDPKKLDEGAASWVSMANALGWESSEGGVYFHPMSYGRRGVWPADEPAPTIRGVIRGMPDSYKPHPRDVVMRSNYGTGGDSANRGERTGDQPAATVTSKVDRNLWQHGEQPETSTKVTVEEASALQSYPADFDWGQVSKTKAYLQIGNAVPPKLAEAILREVLS